MVENAHYTPGFHGDHDLVSIGRHLGELLAT